MCNTPPATTALLKEKAMCPTAVSGTAVLDLGGTQGAEAVLVALLGKSCGVEEAQRRHGSDLRGWVERGAGALLANHTLTLGEGASTSGAGHSRSGRGGALGGGGRLATFSVLSPYDILPVRSSMSSMLLLLASAGFSVSFTNCTVASALASVRPWPQLLRQQRRRARLSRARPCTGSSLPMRSL